jgi:hypothetical protein
MVVFKRKPSGGSLDSVVVRNFWKSVGKFSFPSHDHLKSLYLNARSLKAFVRSREDPSAKVCKISLLQDLVYSGDYDLVCICETWLNNTVFSSELLTGYSIFRKDRTGQTGGGVLVAVKNEFKVSRRKDLEREITEMVVVELVTRGGSRPMPAMRMHRSKLRNHDSYCLKYIDI